MSERSNRQWCLAKRPYGMLDQGNFEYRVVDVPALADGQVLVRNLYLSFDPAQRGWLTAQPGYRDAIEIGAVVPGGTVGEVVESRHPDYAVGDLVQGMNGWQDYTVHEGAARGAGRKLAPGTDPALALSVLGGTGLTAYWGLLDLGKPAAGETVLVSGAAGATGSVAGQIARIKGCRVVGIAGGPAKCAWLTNAARFDAAIDYKNEDVDARIGQTCPEGVDIFFDNVGGATLEAGLNHINLGARVVLCGGISGYNETAPVPGPSNIMNLVVRRARMEGFLLFDYLPRSGPAAAELAAWVESGEIAHVEDVQEGFQNIPQTLLRLFTGANFGKQLLKLADPS